MTSFLRPDEIAAQADIEKSGRQTQSLKSGLKTAANIATGLAGAGIAAKTASSLSTKIMPFLNKYIPVDMAINGISKVSPEIGGLLKKGVEKGLNIEDGLDFLKGQVEKKSSPAKDQRNIIEQYSPELFSFLKEQIGQGKSPIEAGALAQIPKSKFSSVIKKIEDDNKTNWSSIIQSVFGQSQGDINQNKNNPSDTEIMESKMDKFFDKQKPQAQSQPSQMGPGQQALMQMIQQINQKLGS